MTNNQNMQNWHLTSLTDKLSDDQTRDYDISFIYSIDWNSPSTQIPQALKILLCPPQLKPSVVPPSRWADDAVFDTSSVQSWQTRRILASHPDTPPQVLENIAVGSAPDITARVAENPSTDPETLARLAWSDQVEVRRAVADNDNAPPWTVRFLAADDNPDVRYALADNPSLDCDVLHQLSADDNPYVAQRAIDTLRRLNASDCKPVGVLARVMETLRRQFLGAR